MSRILHVEDDAEIRKLVAEVLSATDHELVQCESVRSAEDERGAFDLYICGTMGKHSDGLLFALEQEHLGHRVLIVADKQKFERMPFFATTRLREKEQALEAFERALTQ